MLGEDPERDAWLQVRQSILSDPQELHRRLTPRRMMSLTRPPRAWCITLRASNTRTNPPNVILTCHQQKGV
jgi:hypothetical protein